MKEISILPGRVRFKETGIYLNKALSKYINNYCDNLYGVKYCKVDCQTSTILIEYDTNKTNYKSIKHNIEQAISSLSKTKMEKLNEYESYFNIIEKREKAKRKFLVYGLIYVIFKIKQSIYGKFSFSTNLRILQIASLITILGGYPLIRGLFVKNQEDTSIKFDRFIRFFALVFSILRESTDAMFVLVLTALNDYIKFSAEVECIKTLQENMHKTAGMVWLNTMQDQEILVHISSLEVGDIITLHKGEIVPLEGEVVNGSAIVNSLYSTGQPIISQVKVGSKIYEGITILSGELKVRILKLPESLSKEDIPLQSLAINNRVKSYQHKITPVSVAGAVLSYAFTRSSLNALSVMLTLDPTASEVALNSGIKTYVSLLNKNKIYLRNSNTFENIVKTNNIIFDKTGTLTYGRMRIEHIESFDRKYSKNKLLSICAACEMDNYHPISITIKEETGINYDISKVQSSILIPSKGISAVYENHRVLIGNAALMKEHNIDLSKEIGLYLNYERNLCTPVFISINNRLSGIIVMKDVLREDSYEMIKRLRSKGIHNISILTGDNYDNASNISSQLGIDSVYSNCNYKDKLKIVQNNKGHSRVMMVGDGINDILAMRSADVSVSFVSSACDNVKLHSDCIILENNMEKLPDLISISQRSYRAINQTITISNFYNAAFGALAFLGYINPFAAKTINTLNSAIVILLNQRIQYFKMNKMKFTSDKTN